MKLLKTVFVIFLFLYVANAFGQPTDKQVMELSAGVTKYSGQTGAENAEKVAIEKEYLDMARKNIESYRKGVGSLVFVDTKGEPLKKN